MVKAHTLGMLESGRVSRVAIFASAWKDDERTVVRGFDVQVDTETVERLRTPLHRLAIPIDGTDSMYRWGRGVEVDVVGDRAAVSPRSCDLAIAVSIAAVQCSESPALRTQLAHSVLLGEIGSEGDLLSVEGALPLLLGAGEGWTAIVPRGNAIEAAREGARVFVADTLEQVLQHLRGETRLAMTA